MACEVNGWRDVDLTFKSWREDAKQLIHGLVET